MKKHRSVQCVFRKCTCPACNNIVWFIYFCLNISGSTFESSGFSFAGIDEINRIPSPTEIFERNTSPDSGIDTIDVESTEPKTALEAIKGKKCEINFITYEPGKDPKTFFYISYFDHMTNFINILTRRLGTGICNYNMIVEFKTGYINSCRIIVDLFVHVFIQQFNLYKYFRNECTFNEVNYKKHSKKFAILNWWQVKTRNIVFQSLQTLSRFENFSLKIPPFEIFFYEILKISIMFELVYIYPR